MMQFLVVVSLLNIQLEVVQLKDFTTDRNFDFNVDENASRLLEPKAFLSTYFLTRDPKRAPNPTLQLSSVAIRPDKDIAKGIFREQDHLFSKWQTLANIPSDLKPLENPKPLDMYQVSTNLSSRSLSCPSDQFACKDGSGCIPYWAVCSGSGGGGCKDLSHTLASQCNNCTADHLFKCKMGGVDICLHTDFICDRTQHCMDGSDESESLCSPPCSTGMFACANGLQCIPRSALCNGFGNCGDLSHTRPFQCDNCAADHLFKCQISGVDVCLNARFKCDGFDHCHDNVDEKPDDDQFICDDGLGCFPLSYRCDAVHNCKDGSDESESLCTPPCPPDMFACSDGSKCIPRSKLCNGFGSCEDFSHSLPSHCDNCSADHLFKCQRHGDEVCLDVRQKCDGTIHCDDGDDEKPSECGGCHSDLFACADDSFSTLNLL